jgi:ArsR family transcriptional regulator, lead/cadmium/zinc/bismuth-responsive transcriptional repressor
VSTPKPSRAAAKPEAECDHDHGPRRRPRFSEAAIERAAAIFRAAGEPSRLRLLELLLQGELCVTEIASSLDDGLSTVSQRLRVLRAEGLVSRRRDKKHLYYTLADQHVVDVLVGMLDHATHPPHSHWEAPASSKKGTPK